MIVVDSEKEKALPASSDSCDYLDLPIESTVFKLFEIRISLNIHNSSFESRSTCRPTFCLMVSQYLAQCNKNRNLVDMSTEFQQFITQFTELLLDQIQG
ncbi:hypothetical protein SDC9_81656 [bioreactor metagenome]|uniref:Uncharacterized protein n=1 Tax=bioreactor metagenome TaxID=1076179 RepID=A0A644Z2J1_9ZZZZ